MTEVQFKEITEWQERTFPAATAQSKVLHLRDEVNELMDDLRIGSPSRRLEFADCFILLFGAAAADGMTYEDICNAIDDKFEINKSRKWGKPDANGVVRHVEREG